MMQLAFCKCQLTTVSETRAHNPREFPAGSPLTLENWHSDGLLISGPLPSRWKQLWGPPNTWGGSVVGAATAHLKKAAPSLTQAG